MMTAAASSPAKDHAASVLVVEDEVLIRFTIAAELRAAGFVVFEAANADEAITVLTSPVQIDALVTDIRMPGSIDGERLVSLVREARPNLKIVVISGVAAHTSIGKYADAIIDKPFDPKRIVETLINLLKVPK